MCSLPIALGVLTTGFQMSAQHQQTKAAVQTAEAQAEAAEQNAKLQNRQGELIAEQYGQKQRELDNRRRLVQGAQRAEAGASGIAGGMGTAMDMQVATTNAWQEDSENLLGNQREAVYNNYIKEVNYRNQAESYRAQAAAARRAGSMAQWGTLLSGAASLYGMKVAKGTSAANNNGYALYAGPQAGSAGYLKGAAANVAFNKDIANLGTSLYQGNVLNKSVSVGWGKKLNLYGG